MLYPAISNPRLAQISTINPRYIWSVQNAPGEEHILSPGILTLDSHGRVILIQSMNMNLTR